MCRFQNGSFLHFNGLNNTSNTWPKFARSVRSKQDKLLSRLEEFPDSILIAGCQRSGTTMLARIRGKLKVYPDFTKRVPL
jgi:hypothetical protein